MPVIEKAPKQTCKNINQRYSFASGISDQYLEDQGSKTLVSDNSVLHIWCFFLNQILHMDHGDFLELRTDYGFFTGEVLP